MARNKFLRKPLKYEEEKVHILTTVIKIEEQNVLVGKKYKTVFYCSSSTKPEGARCIAWGYTAIAEGSEVTLTGRFKNDCFLVWSMNIINSIRREREPIPPCVEEIKKKLKERKAVVLPAGAPAPLHATKMNENLKIEEKQVTQIKITGTKKLDTITVYIDERRSEKRPNKVSYQGRIIILCYDIVLTHFWNAMAKPLREFFITADTRYIADKFELNTYSSYSLHAAIRNMSEHQKKYVCEIIETVKDAFRKKLKETNEN